MTTLSSAPEPRSQSSHRSHRSRHRKSRFSKESVLDFEESDLFQWIHSATESSFLAALESLPTISSAILRGKSSSTGNTYFHELVLSLQRLHKHNEGDTRVAIVVLYQLTLRGCDINAQNLLGHTALHLACFRPCARPLMVHLLRLGCDPCLENNQGYRIFVDLSTFQCQLVKDQPNIYCSIWQAVQKEDFPLLDRFLSCWFRVSCKRKRKSMLDVAYDTSNFEVVHKLQKAEKTNDFVAACFAADLERANELSRLRFDRPNLNSRDKSEPIAKPLLSCMLDLLPYTEAIVELLQSLGVNGDEEYRAQCKSRKIEFEECDFYQLLQDPTEDSVKNAWSIVDRGELSLGIVSKHQGDSLMHLVVRRYCGCPTLGTQRSLIRLMHKLALAGVDVNHRNEDGQTVLLTAFELGADRRFMDYLINLGVDSSYRCRRGCCVTVNAYATRGQLVVRDFASQRRYLPGLWPAVVDNDLERVQLALASLARVNSVRAGRNSLQFAKDCGNGELVELLGRYFYLTEFAVAALAADSDRMKYCLAMGQGVNKVNAVYNHFYAGLADNWKVEFVVRPILVSVMEICPATIVQKFIDYGVNLQVHYEEEAPCAPIAFWAFRDDVDEEISIVVARHADLSMRDEQGSTLLHRAVVRNGSVVGKTRLLEILLERRVNVAARDLSKRTPRDYCELNAVQHGAKLCQMIDDHVLNMVYEGNYDAVEDLVLQGYDHLLDVRGTARNKTAIELAQLRYSKELVELLQGINRYQDEMCMLQAAVVAGDASGCTRLLSEKKVAWSVDKRHRTILHLAVLYRHSELVGLICDQFPQLIHQQDVLQRSPVHYAVGLHDRRQILSIISTSNSVNLQVREANNLTALDYAEELECPTPSRAKTRGRRVHNYDIRNIIRLEKEDAERELSPWLPRDSPAEIRDDTFVTNLGTKAHTVA